MTDSKKLSENAKEIRTLFNHPKMVAKIEKMLGKNTSAFVTTVLQIVGNDKKLSNADPTSVYLAACTAAALGLPVNKGLGFAFILPYDTYAGKDGNGQNVYKTEAQFQMGYKGFIQLAMRTDKFKNINACAIYEGDNEKSIYDRLTMLFPPLPPASEPIAYIAHFKLLNGFEAHEMMRIEDIKAHAASYSTAYQAAEKLKPNEKWKQKFSQWHENFEDMALKTVIKRLLSRRAPLSIDSALFNAIDSDQAVMRDVNGENIPDYVDNKKQAQAGYVDQNASQLQMMDATHNPDLFNTIVNGVIMGRIKIEDLESGAAGYVVSDQQLSDIKQTYITEKR